METFRVGCIDAIDANEMRNVVAAIALVPDEMGVRGAAPHASSRA